MWEGPYHSVEIQLVYYATPVDYATGGFKKFHFGCKNLDDQVSLGRPKTVDSKAVLRAVKVNLVRIIWRVPDESSVICHLHDFKKPPEQQNCALR